MYDFDLESLREGKSLILQRFEALLGNPLMEDGQTLRHWQFMRCLNPWWCYFQHPSLTMVPRRRQSWALWP